MSPGKKLIDEKCIQLSRHFQGDGALDADVISLAEYIQDCVESWFEIEAAELPDAEQTLSHAKEGAA